MQVQQRNSAQKAWGASGLLFSNRPGRNLREKTIARGTLLP
jgi:hypothetical protein